MDFTDEKDYIMRIIKEMVRVLFSLVFGKKYVSVEIEKENKYEVCIYQSFYKRAAHRQADHGIKTI